MKKTDKLNFMVFEGIFPRICLTFSECILFLVSKFKLIFYKIIINAMFFD